MYYIKQTSEKIDRGMFFEESQIYVGKKRFQDITFVTPTPTHLVRNPSLQMGHSHVTQPVQQMELNTLTIRSQPRRLKGLNQYLQTFDLTPNISLEWSMAQPVPDTTFTKLSTSEVKALPYENGFRRLPVWFASYYLDDEVHKEVADAWQNFLNFNARRQK